MLDPDPEIRKEVRWPHNFSFFFGGGEESRGLSEILDEVYQVTRQVFCGLDRWFEFIGPGLAWTFYMRLRAQARGRSG